MSSELQNLISGLETPPTVSGSTSFGLYDNDATFISEAQKTAKWVARSLGDPIIQIELTWNNVYDLFSDAVSEYSSIVNNSNMKNWLLSLLGADISGSNFTHKLPQNTFSFNKRRGDAIGTEVGVGGNIDWKSGSIELEANKQIYDLQEWASGSEDNKRIEVRDIYHFRPGAPIVQGRSLWGTIDGILSDLDAGYTAETSTIFYMYPVFEDVLRASELELSNKIRKSSYSYELINNKLRLFPTPQDNMKLWFRYTVEADNPIQNDDTSDSNSISNIASDISNIPYEFMEYSNINSMGKNWIKKYTLALSKITLGTIRSKYSSIPIPNDELTMDGDSLIQEGTEMKRELIEELKEIVEETSIERMTEKESNIKQNMQSTMDDIPLLPMVE